jgi:hypothetical protein
MKNTVSGTVTIFSSWIFRQTIPFSTVADPDPDLNKFLGQVSSEICPKKHIHEPKSSETKIPMAFTNNKKLILGNFLRPGYGSG